MWIDALMYEDRKCLKYSTDYNLLWSTRKEEKPYSAIGVNLSYAPVIFEEKIESVMEEKEEFGSESELAHQA
jgi:hypothetical protein